MTALVNGNTKKYSWWWDSHISPKNSKWLKENLTDMDSNVKKMIKVLEEDADSFARKAEMYYKKRPELMKLVEEFYRQYRALAERYDHATGVIRHAQKTMAEAFPNQDPMMMFGEEQPPVGSSNDDFDPQTPESYPHIRAPIYPEELRKDALGMSFSHMSTVKRNIAFMEDQDPQSNGKGLNGRARKGLNFNDSDGYGRNAKVLSESERASKAEAEIVALKEALSKVQAEKEANIAQFAQNLERLSSLESEVSRAQEDSKGLNERATRAEAEVVTLGESLDKLEVEKESSLLQYQQCLQNIADLEARISLAQKEAGEVNERASKAEAETIDLKESLVRSETDKEAALVQYQQCLETISNLEERLRKAEEDAMLLNQRAEYAEAEVESLKQKVSKLMEENEAYELQYQQCLDTIADLRLKLFHAQEETQRLSREIEDGVAKLKFAEEKCVVLEKSNQNLHTELDGLLEKLGNQSHELTEKEKEMGRLWTSVQEEHLRFMEAETAFQTLQEFHSQSQEELSTLELELQNRSQILKDMEARNNGLQEEVQEAKNETKNLSELNLSSAASIKSLQEEVSRLRETIQRLEAEVELRVDQRNALQQEIYCLKEELSQMVKKHQSMVEQVEFVGLLPESFGSSVKDLQEENSKLKESKERENIEKMVLLEKLEMMEKLVQKNLLLENSIADLNSELETIRGKLKTLEDSCLSLGEEKSGLLSEKDVLISRLQSATEDSEKLSEGNRLLENSLFDANAELEELKSKLKSLEDSCRLLNDDKSSLTDEQESLLSYIDVMRKSIEDLETEQTELKTKVSELATERESSLQKIQELVLSLDAKDRKYASYVHSAEIRINGMESKIHQLQDESQVEQDRAHDAHIEIIVLQKCLQDWLEKSSSLIAENQNIKEASKLLEKLVSELKQENIGKQAQIDSSINCIKILRTGIHQVLMKLEIVPGIESCDEKNMHDILSRLDELQTMLLKIHDENQNSVIENLVLVEFLRQVKSEAVGIATQKQLLEEELESQCKQLSLSRDETQKLIYVNGELTTKVNQGVNREEVLKMEVDDLHKQVLRVQDDYSVLQEENYKTLDDKTHLEEKKRELEEDISLLLSETIYQSNLILLLEDVVLEKLSVAMKLNEDLERLSFAKCQLEEEVIEVGDKLKSAETENLELEGLLEKSNAEIANVKDRLDQKEKELVEAMLMISLVQNEKSELSKAVEGLECRYKEAKAIEEDKDNQVSKLLGDYDEQVKKNDLANEANLKLEADLMNLLVELKGLKAEKEKLNQKLDKERNEIELWESQAATLFGDLQISNVRETFLEGVTRELTESCKSLESRSASKDSEIDQIKGRMNSLEDQAETLFGDLQISAVREALLEGLTRELTKECKSLESRSASNNSEIKQLKGRVNNFENRTETLLGDLQISAVREALLEGLTRELTEECKSLESRSVLNNAEIKQLKARVENFEDQTETLLGNLQISAVREALLEGLTCELTEECKSLESRSVLNNAEIKQLKGRVNNLEDQTETLLGDLQISAVREALLEGLTRELTEECKSLESRSMLNNAEIKQLKARVENFEDQTETLLGDLQISAVRETVLQGFTREVAEDCKSLERRSVLKDREIEQLKKKVNNFEDQTETLFGDLQTSAVHETLLEGLTLDLSQECESRSALKDMEIDQLKGKVSHLENQAETLFGDLQMSNVHETLLEGLTRELTEACKCLESRSTLKDMEIDQLKGRVNNLEDSNKGQNNLISKYVQAIVLLKESIDSLEKHFASPHEFENEPIKETASVMDSNDGFIELQEMRLRIKAIEAAVTKKLAMEEELKSASFRRNRRRNGSMRKQNHEIDEIMITKDIVLDQVSDCSSYGIMSRRETLKKEEEDDHSIEVEPTLNPQKSKSLSEESLVVDKLEISDRFTDPNREVNRKKVLERLDSDLQKLANLHVAVEDLKTKVEKEEKSEYETVKEQIHEAEDALEKLLSVNRKLMTKVRSGFERSDGGSMDLDENESSRRRRISEQARRGSEKIGRLQLEIQRLQFLLLKLEEDKAKVDSKTRTLLRDYIYGGGVKGERRKRIKKRFAFCGCVQQPPPSP